MLFGMTDSLPVLPENPQVRPNEIEGMSPLEIQVLKLTKMVQELATLQMSAVTLATSSLPVAAGPSSTPVAAPGAAALSASEDIDMEQSEKPVDVVKSCITDITKKAKLPNELLMNVKIESAKFRKLLRALERSRTHLKLVELKAGRTPPGCRPWKARDESLLWKQSLGNAADGLPFGLSSDALLDAAKAKLSMEFYVCNAVVDIRYGELRVAELETGHSVLEQVRSGRSFNRF